MQSAKSMIQFNTRTLFHSDKMNETIQQRLLSYNAVEFNYNKVLAEQEITLFEPMQCTNI